ncbi:hypothetical protein TNCT_140101 [Trichonephila clavata]|uniref:Uncharacterized protein n=1 Tax=Trichonephila clavata TaxID=2740835 RepID=A0A8X6H7G2_TRICU|nr:hypothetical protein TNCT_140101 [Trichonephila clavata]
MTKMGSFHEFSKVTKRAYRLYKTTNSVKDAHPDNHGLLIAERQMQYVMLTALAGLRAVVDTRTGQAAIDSCPNAPADARLLGPAFGQFGAATHAAPILASPTNTWRLLTQHPGDSSVYRGHEYLIKSCSSENYL